jgi:hypothetical protein
MLVRVGIDAAEKISQLRWARVGAGWKDLVRVEYGMCTAPECVPFESWPRASTMIVSSVAYHYCLADCQPIISCKSDARRIS